MRWAGHVQRRDMRYRESGAGDELPGRKKSGSRSLGDNAVREDMEAVGGRGIGCGR